MVFATGDLKNRIEYNLKRLSSKEYCAPEIFSKSPDWPGDWQGRAILALCSLYEASGDLSALKQVESVINELPNHLNEYCYFGEIIANSGVNEQQLSGNSWFVRGLCAYYRLTKDKKVYKMLEELEKNFFLHLEPFYGVYAVENFLNGGVSGHVSEKSADGWLHSSDIGCAFILLDGITELCTIIKSDKLLKLAKDMANKFLSIDYLKTEFQTHAFLSATRGILKLYSLTDEKSYLISAENNFELYVKFGSTVNYANYNWFGQTSSWTEPCAFIDSLILAVELFKITENEKYLRFSNRVYLNAYRCAQRANGGAGCETCLSEKNGELKMHLYEAFFCCTMRFADGLNFVRKNLFFEKDGQIYSLFTLGGKYQTEECAFEYFYDYENSRVQIKVERGNVNSLWLYLPENVKLYENGIERENTLSNLCRGVYEYQVKAECKLENKAGREAYFWSDFLLTEKLYKDDSTVKFYIDGKVLSPIGECISVEEKYGIENYIQIL